MLHTRKIKIFLPGWHYISPWLRYISKFNLIIFRYNHNFFYFFRGNDWHSGYFVSLQTQTGESPWNNGNIYTAHHNAHRTYKARDMQNNTTCCVGKLETILPFIKPRCSDSYFGKKVLLCSCCCMQEICYVLALYYKL